MKRRRTPVFYRVHESQVDEVLDHLSDSQSLPDRCLVIGSSMSLLGALCTQWAGRVEIIVVFIPKDIGDVREAAETIAINEGLELTELLWVCREGWPPDAEGPSRTTLAAGDGDARDLADKLSRWLPLP